MYEFKELVLERIFFFMENKRGMKMISKEHCNEPKFLYCIKRLSGLLCPKCVGNHYCATLVDLMERI